jgi:hypothetical protein
LGKLQKDKESQLMGRLLSSGTANDKLNAAVFFINVKAFQSEPKKDLLEACRDSGEHGSRSEQKTGLEFS